MKAEKIFVALLDEGVGIYRPVPAWKIDESIFIVLRPDWYDPEDEHWEFLPGSTVVCERKTISNGDILAAVRLQEVDQLTA